MSSATDRIEKSVLLRAPVERVWAAVGDAKRFGQWFGAEIDGAFAPGAHLKGRIAPTKVDAEIARTQEPYSGRAIELWIERVEPMRHLSFRWHPFAIDPGLDYSHEPTTLVAFELEAAAGGTRLTITESGFDAIPIERRAVAFSSNEGGWAAQAKLIEKYLAAEGR